MSTKLGSAQADYANAKAALDRAITAATRTHAYLVAALPTLPSLLGSAHDILKVDIQRYLADARSWGSGTVPTSANLTFKLGALLSELDERIAEIESRQGEHTYGKAKAKIERLLECHAEIRAAERMRDQVQLLANAVTTQATFVAVEIRRNLQALLDKLQKPTNDIYRKIQGIRAAPIRLELPPEEDTNQQRLNLVVDFATNRTGVPPGGYLSDSQLHSVALALRLAAIKRFNAAAPIVALDDVVTSYDADHRRAIAGLIASDFSEQQMIITTHDERFFNYLKDQLNRARWLFTRIIKIDPEWGPQFASHRVTDEMIEARWNTGESAANEIRQAEEEWLLDTQRGPVNG